MPVLILFDSPLKSCNMGASKRLSDDLKTKIIQHYGLGEVYKKLSKRFQLSVSTVRNIVRKWKATGTVLVKPRSGRPSKIPERQSKRIVRMIKNNPQTTSKDLQGCLAADGVAVHRSTIQRNLHKERLYGKVMRKKPFLHSPSNITELQRFCKEESSRIQTLIGGYRKHLQAVIFAKGGSTKY
ncbi:hypothetical protein ACEWY4_015607 [Coilia grayii]|uniref:Transposase Tc1-like domain-containing protein n=1 Tax=Coilia grayii TaxID=363190 RepID=A0ABD1JNH1_9TELE